MKFLEGLFSLSGVVAFMTGVLLTRCYYFGRDKWMDRVDPANAPHHRVWKSVVMAGALTVLAVLYIGVQTQKTHDATLDLAQSTRYCEQQFNSAFSARSRALDEADSYADQERRALVDWLTQIVDPPPDVAATHTTDPAYQGWARAITQIYLDRITALQNERQAALNKRGAIALPDAKCGGRI